MLYIVDNYDSFTFNIAQFLKDQGVPSTVIKNDAGDLLNKISSNASHIILSPGPGKPSESGQCRQVIERFLGKVPILGICLGHELIAEYFGAKIVHAIRIMHGVNSDISHDKKGVFKNLPNNLSVTRYHSLIVDPDTLGSELEISAWTQFNEHTEIMGIRHKRYSIEGVQFHPEAILSDSGKELLHNFAMSSSETFNEQILSGSIQ